MEAFSSLILLFISQYMCIPNHDIVYLNLHMLHINNTSKKLGEIRYYIIKIMHENFYVKIPKLPKHNKKST